MIYYKYTLIGNRKITNVFTQFISDNQRVYMHTHAQITQRFYMLVLQSNVSCYTFMQINCTSSQWY